MAVTFQAVGSLAQQGSDTLPITAPSLAADDIMVAQIMETAGSHAMSSAPSGWAALHAANIASGSARAYLYWKRAVGGDSGASFSWTSGGATQLSGVISAWRGCITGSSPIDATAPSVQTNTSATDQIDYADFDPTESSAWVVAMGFYKDDATTAGAISGTDPIFVNNYDLESATFGISFFAYSGSSTGAATGTRSHVTTSTTDAINQGVLFGLVQVTVAADDLMAGSMGV